MHTITLHLTEALQKLVCSDKSNDIPNQHYQGATALTFTPVKFQLVWEIGMEISGRVAVGRLGLLEALGALAGPCIVSSCAFPVLCWQGNSRGANSRVANISQAVLEEAQLL